MEQNPQENEVVAAAEVSVGVGGIRRVIGLIREEFGLIHFPFVGSFLEASGLKAKPYRDVYPPAERRVPLTPSVEQVVDSE